MKAFERFATKHPVLFGCLVVLVFILSIILAGVLAYAVPGKVGTELVAAGTKLGGVFLLLYLLHRLGWRRAAGAAMWDSWQPWLLTLPAIIYSLIANQIALFGGIELRFPDPMHAASVAINMLVDGGFQEIAFRGILLFGLVRVWGDKKRGIVQSVLLSSALFGGLHILNLASGAPLQVTLLQMTDTLIAGVYYAALVLYGENIWPVALWHGLLNAAASARAVGIPDFQETISMWTMMILFNLPLLFYGIYLLYRLEPRPVVSEVS